MNALTIEDQPGEQTLERLEGAWAGTEDLTLQEIEAGLQRLQAKLDSAQRLPFIVLIEDDEVDAQLFRSALKSVHTPVEFMHFSDGLQAMDFFRGKGSFSDREKFPLPNLVVLDFKLDRGTGLEILRLIRSEALLKDLPVVALSASNDEQELKEAHLLGINDWLNKPQDHAILINIVRQMLQRWLFPKLESGDSQ